MIEILENGMKRHDFEMYCKILKAIDSSDQSGLIEIFNKNYVSYIPTSNRNYYESIRKLGGGQIAGGQGLGIMVGDDELSLKCPQGWIFVNINNASNEIIHQCVLALREGRKHWPAKESMTKKGELVEENHQ